MIEVILLALLLVKHFVFDFYWQPQWMLQSKGHLGAWGGIAHSGAHALATMAILLVFNILSMDVLLFPLEAYAFDAQTIAIVALIEFAVHYWTDFFKMNINTKKGWGPTTHNQFWQLTGLDQLIHQLTYVWIVWFIAADRWALQ